MKHLLAIFTLMCLSLSASAQGDDVKAAIAQINGIKKDASTYLFAECTSAKWEEAYDNAKAILEIKMEEWAHEYSKTEDITGCIAKADNSIFQIKTRRGDLYRAFLYVKKNDIMTYSTEKEIVSIPVEKSGSESEEPVSVQHTAPETVSVLVPNEPSPAQEETYYPSASEQQFLDVTSFYDIQSFIQNNSNVDGYGKYATMPSSGDYYVFVYNKQGDIAAHLKHNGSGYINVATGKEDNLTNYKGCGAFWFRSK